jgi:hypothetical protein
MDRKLLEAVLFKCTSGVVVIGILMGWEKRTTRSKMFAFSIQYPHQQRPVQAWHRVTYLQLFGVTTLDVSCPKTIGFRAHTTVIYPVLM